MIWNAHPSKSFLQFIMIHRVKGFSIIDETEVDVLLKFPCFLYNPVKVGNLMSSSSSFSKPSLDTWNFLFHIMLKSSMQDFRHELTSMGDECGCPKVSTFFGTTFLRIGMRIDFFQSCGHCCILGSHTGISQVAQMVKNLPANEGGPSLIPGLGRSPQGVQGNPL